MTEKLSAFYVLEETKMNGETLSFSERFERRRRRLPIFADKSNRKTRKTSYEFVDDDGELDYMSKIFEELMSDLGVEIEK